jgi:phytoene desaturase
MSNSKKAIVVGSGIAGIASALRLRSKGYEVTVFEANPYPGGKLSLNQLGNYRFDAGPSLFTMPQYVDELFQLFDKNPGDYFQYVTNDIACHYFFPDGTFIPFFVDCNKTVHTVEKTLSIDGSPLLKQFKKSEYIYEKTHSIFLESSLHTLKNYTSKNIFSSIRALPFLDIFKTMHQSNVKGLNHPKLVQIFDRYATYNGSNPYQAPGILNIIPHLEHGIGSFFPTKGMHSITTSLVNFAKEMGVNFILNSKVSEILVEGKKVKGVKVNDVIYDADVVFCNSDIKPAYSNLLKNLPKPKKTLNQEPSSSAMIFYWGINKSFTQLDLHNIFFSADYAAEFDAIFKQSTVCDDPTVYIHVSSKIVKGDAPEGCENWFVMVNVPYNSGQDWERLRSIIRKNTLKKLNFLLGEDLEMLIEEEDYLDPIRIEQRTSSFGGALYGASSNDRMAAFFRHPNFSKITGLYFVGGSVHPGGGIPLCLLSAKIATEFVK